MDFNQIKTVFETLRLTPPSKLTLLNGAEFTLRHYPPTPPDVDTLILNIDSAEMLAQVKFVLLAGYADSHKVSAVGMAGVTVTSLGEVGGVGLSYPISLFVPSLGEGTSFEAFAEIVAHLRAPDGCPWDKEQTHQTLRKHLLEESYETLSAMDADDVEGMREEFGDLLLQIVLNSYIAYQDAEFNFTGVTKGIYDKIVRRHPHVFGDLELDGVDGVLQNWEKLKEKERKGNKEDKGILDGVASALPALNQAQEYQDRAARVGFDWPEIEDVLDKVREEIEEVKTAENAEQVKEELGDLFFVLVNLARWRDVDAEAALREANQKFKRRFAHIEKNAKAQGRNLSDMTLEEMDALWDESKKLGI
ncbi:MAG: nucleoside triphosphate pyrophosphohydrolase [Anaerolineales bacterium]|nr:nucleoside triphosphate pyrophosphohydrolase [Anaerolineales bacterium]MCB9145541.1 nucleoside triphosphate pyrophosphohydrolase [Anaerolineales bacterium]